MTDEQPTQPLGEVLHEQLSQSEVYAEVPYLVTEKEIEQLAEALAAGNAEADKPEMTHEQLQSLVLWATGAKLAYMLFQEVISGTLDVTIENGEPIFSMHKKQDQEEASDGNAEELAE